MIKDNSTRARNASSWLIIALSWKVFIIILTQFLSPFIDYNLWSPLLRIERFISLAITLITLVVVIKWFRRAYYNLHQRSSQLSYSEGWAAGAWFVPILNWIRPFQIMKELWNESMQRIDVSGNPSISGALDGKKLITPWWVCWVFASVYDSLITLSVRIFDGSYSLYSYSTYGFWLAIILRIAAGIMLIVIIKKYTIIENVLLTSKTSSLDQFGTTDVDENWE